MDTATPELQLMVYEPGRDVFAVPLRDGLSIGRHHGNDLVLLDPHASRRHAQMMRVGPSWMVVDLSSMHGTFINGERAQRSPLAIGDEVHIGSSRLVLSHAGESSLVLCHDLTRPPHDDSLPDARLRLLTRVTRAIESCDDPEPLVAELLAALRELYGCERAVAGLLAPEGVELRLVTQGSPGAPPTRSRTLMDALLVRRQAVVLYDAGSSTRGDSPGLRSAMAVPLQTAAQLYGFFYLEDHQRAHRFSRGDLDQLAVVARLSAAALEQGAARRRAEAMAAAWRDDPREEPLIAASPAMQACVELIERLARIPRANLLVSGEAGSGKELVARAFHQRSTRHQGPFITVACAALVDAEPPRPSPEQARSRWGRLLAADGGTLFLDEVADLSAAAQARLVEVIERGAVQPPGVGRPLTVDIRVVAATRKDLALEVAAGRFRSDLFNRLAVLELRVPPLRERRLDLAPLAAHFLERIGTRLGRAPQCFSAAALAALQEHDWPGNARELMHEVERAAFTCEAPIIDVEVLGRRVLQAIATDVRPSPLATPPAPNDFAAELRALESQERALVQAALAEAQGNATQAARLLGLTRVMVQRRMRRYGLDGAPGGDDV